MMDGGSSRPSHMLPNESAVTLRHVDSSCPVVANPERAADSLLLQPCTFRAKVGQGCKVGQVHGWPGLTETGSRFQIPPPPSSDQRSCPSRHRSCPPSGSA